MAVVTPEYIQWPGAQTFPGKHTFPAYDDRADGTTVVHAHNGAQWTESADGLALAVAKLAQGAAQSAVVRMQAAAGGQVGSSPLARGAPPHRDLPPKPRASRGMARKDGYRCMTVPRCGPPPRPV